MHVPSKEHGTKPTESAVESVRKNITIDVARKTRRGGFCEIFGSKPE